MTFIWSAGGSRGRALILPLAVCLILTACGKTAAPERPPEPGDVAVARVNGQTIWTSDVRNEAIAQGAIGQGEPLDATSSLFSRTLEEVIDQRLLADAAVRRGLDKSLSAQRRLQAARDRILGDMLVETTIDREIDDKAVKAQYDEQVRLAKASDEVRARIMVLKTKAEAEAALAQVQGGAVFEALAMEKSIDQATRFGGGDMGYITEDVMPQAYKDALTTANELAVAGGGAAPFKVTVVGQEKTVRSAQGLQVPVTDANAGPAPAFALVRRRGPAHVTDRATGRCRPTAASDRPARVSAPRSGSASPTTAGTPRRPGR